MLQDYQEEEAPIQLAQMGNPGRDAAWAERLQGLGEIEQQAIAREREKRKKLADLQSDPNVQAFFAREQEQRQLQQLFQRNPKLQEQFMLEREKARLRPAAAAPAPIQIKDAAGNVKLVDQKGNLIKDLGPVGAPSPGFTKAQAAKTKMNQDLDQVIPMLQEISREGGLIDQSTGSGIGAGVDYAAKAFGYGTKGAVAVGKLKPIVDPILKLVPRFEGPQSDKDTQTYRDAAGDLANPAQPNNIKKAAAKVILDMYIKRRGQFTTTDYDTATADYAGPERRTASDTPPPGAVRRKSP